MERGADGARGEGGGARGWVAWDMPATAPSLNGTAAASRAKPKHSLLQDATGQEDTTVRQKFSTRRSSAAPFAVPTHSFNSADIGSSVASVPTALGSNLQL